MNLLKVALRRETALTVLALTFASGVSVALVVARIIWTWKLRYGFLAWNLFLAWIPLILALLAHEKYQQGAGRSWRFFVLGGAWLLFFPNAPYIFTDLIHLTTRFLPHFWVDLVLVLMCALTGLVLGFVSLFLMQAIVSRMFGRLASWIFIAAVGVLSGWGIYLGRFLRFNSWDVLFQPVKVYHGIGQSLTEPLSNAASRGFMVLFATFLFLAYVMLYGLTHLQRAMPAASPGEAPRLKEA